MSLISSLSNLYFVTQGRNHVTNAQCPCTRIFFYIITTSTDNKPSQIGYVVVLKMD